GPIPAANPLQARDARRHQRPQESSALVEPGYQRAARHRPDDDMMHGDTIAAVGAALLRAADDRAARRASRTGCDASTVPGRFGGAEGDRTLDLRIANAALSQLSYCPTGRELSAS